MSRDPHPWVAEGRSRLRFAVANGPRAGWTEVQRFVQVAEELGFDAYLCADHPMLGNEVWTRMAALAAVTRRIRLGSLVSSVAYRNPVLLARQVADVDEISGGRAVLGLGIGDYPWEFRELGLPFGSTAERQAWLEEALQVIPRLLAGETVTHHGTHVHADGAVLRALSRDQPRVPLLIGGGGERVTLRQVARYTDASNFGPNHYVGGATTLDDVRRKLAALRHHCRDLGRPYETILKTHTTIPIALAETREAVEARTQAVLETFHPDSRPLMQAGMLAATPDEAVRYYRELASAGIQYFIVFVMGNDLDTLRLLGERVVPAVTETVGT